MTLARRPRHEGTVLWALLLAIVGGPISAMAQDGETAAPVGEPALSAEDAIRRSRDDAFEIHVQGADLRGVLQLLSTQGKRNIIATQEVKGSVTADLYGVTFEEALDAVMRSTGYVYEAKGEFIYVYTPKQYEALKQAERKTVVAVFKLSYLTAEDAQTLISPALSRDGMIALTPEAAAGIATSDTETGGNDLGTEDVLVVRDYEENVKQIGELLDKLDIKPEQVLIEATILRATLTEDNDLGIDFNVLCGVDFESLGSSNARLTNPDGTVINQDGTRDFAFNSAFSNAVPAGGMTIGFLTNQVNVFIRALESVTDVTVVANPKLLVVNKQRGEVMIGNRDGYLTTTITETVATQTVQFLETGTRLVVRPYVGKDGYVRMEIHPEDSSGNVVPVGTAQLPRETTTEVTSNVMVRDGHTIVIGGLFRERTDNGRSQIPLAGNVPYLGTLFRSTNDATAREEVIVLVTPHIVRQEEDEQTSEQIRDDVERFRIGQRKGLRCWGRTPLSQTHMRWARAALAAGDRGKALWNIDMALSLQPRMEEAIRLKERLTQQAYWADTARISTVRYVIQQMIMQELGKPVERIVLPGKPRNVENVEPEVREAFGIGRRYEDPLPGEIAYPSRLNWQSEPADDTGDAAVVEETVVLDGPAPEAVESVVEAQGEPQAAADDAPAVEVPAAGTGDPAATETVSDAVEEEVVEETAAPASDDANVETEMELNAPADDEEAQPTAQPAFVEEESPQVG